jgi:F-type H+/Na+-transporting ATPase subunit alpha
MTGLPVIETKGNDVSAYIPTNVISITDGQCFLETDLFNSGVRPAINVGISVSRVGGAAQPRAMRAVSGRLRVDLAQYRELEAFAAFGSDLDKASQQQLARGSRMVELLKQPAASPFPIGQEIVSIWAGTTGKLDDVEVGDVRRFESELLEYVGRHKPELFDVLAEAKSLEDDMVATLEQVVGEFKAQFEGTHKAEAQPVESGGARGANEGRTSSPQGAAHSADNPADDAAAGNAGNTTSNDEPAGAATTPGASEPES